jgi:hypothetical protein
VRRFWERLWFEPAHPLGLGVARAVIFAGALWLYRRADFAAYASVSPLFYGVSWFRPPIAPAEWMHAFRIVWLASLALGCVGLFTRVAMAVAFVLGAYLLGIDANFGRIHHNDLPIVIALGVFAASRAGDAFSIDRLRRRRDAVPDGEYRWPLRAVQLTLAAAFLAAGVAKLRYGGLEWVTSDNLRLRLIERSYGAFPAPEQGLFLARFPLVCHLVAGVTVATELLYPLALVSRRARIVLVPASLLMLAGFAIFFGPRFTTFALLSAAWVPWDRLLARFTAPARAASAPAP